MIDSSYLRQLRKNNHYTLKRLSQETGYTASFLSQIERGLKEPSLTALRKLSEVLEVPIVSFFSSESETNAAPQEEPGGYSVVRRKERRCIDIPGLSVQCEAITRSSSAGCSHSLMGVIYTIPPGGYASESMVSHAYDECTYVLTGEMLAHLPDWQTVLHEGDCIYVSALTPHNFQNCGCENCVLISFNN